MAAEATAPAFPVCLPVYVTRQERSYQATVGGGALRRLLQAKLGLGVCIIVVVAWIDRLVATAGKMASLVVVCRTEEQLTLTI